jgi:cysteine desulfurase
VAAELARSELPIRTSITSELRDRLEKGILQEAPGAYVNGGAAERIPNTTNIGFPGVDSDTLVAVLDTDGLSASSGSACLSNSITPSHVVMAMTGTYAKAREATRFSLSHLTTAEEIERAIGIVARAVDRARNASQKAL